MIVPPRNTRPHFTIWFICILVLFQGLVTPTDARIHKNKRKRASVQQTTHKKTVQKKRSKAPRKRTKTVSSVKRHATHERTPARTPRVVSIEATVRTSVYKALRDVGEHADLVARFTKLLGYDIDFVQEPRSGDTFRILMERPAKGRGGRILAAEYRGEVTGTVRAYWYSPSDGGNGSAYYSAEGDCLERAFMRSPLSVLRVTSPFGMREHPVSGRMAMHKGTDYGAPIGTPVWAVAAGRVSFAGRRGGYGNLVEITHTGNIITRYGHLSRIAVKLGQKINQSQVIGRVGSTGVSTGPHLHFEFLEGGTPVSPRNIKNVALGKLTGKNLAAFKREMERINGVWEKAGRK